MTILKFNKKFGSSVGLEVGEKFAFGRVGSQGLLYLASNLSYSL